MANVRSQKPCNVCRFFKPNPSSLDIQFVREAKKGFCQFNPPSIIIMHGYEEAGSCGEVFAVFRGTETVWPEVSISDACGKWDYFND